MFFFDELWRGLGAPFEKFGFGTLRFVGQRADDERRAGFVDQDAVGLVDQHKRGIALYGLVAVGAAAVAKHLGNDVGQPFARLPEQQAIAEKIETELVGGAVGNVANVSLAAFILRL